MGAAALAAYAQIEDAEARRCPLFCGGLNQVLWTPLNDPNLVAWWDASFLPNLTFNTTNISAIADRKSGIVASQGTGAAQPAWSATARNGKPGMSFVNPSSQILTGISILLPQGSAASAVIVAGYGDPAANTDNGAFGWGTIVNANDGREVNQNLTPPVVQVQNGNGGSTFTSAISWNGVDNCIIYEIASGASPAAKLTINGTNAAATTPIATLSTSSGAFSISGPRRFFYGIIQQIAVSGSVLSTSIRQKYEGWESWYDGKAGLNLPANHPYKNRPPFVSDP